MSGVRRAFALALALSFAGRATAAGIDALLYHNDSGPSPASAHWDPPGGCQSHAERCALRAAPVGPRFVTPSFRTITAADQIFQRIHLRAETQHRSLVRSPLQARAPPFVL
ncbi:MAG: hypothetical protein HY700_07470 [Gemmatimonadetes bacterium]|nr:hypothetical protein [Gemmatimonadota bacterium]